MKQKKIIISLIFCTLCALGCGLFQSKPPERPKRPAPTAVSELNPGGVEGEKITGPGIFTDCTYGLDQSISDHAPVIYGKTGTWNIATLVNPDRIGSSPGFFIHKFRAITAGPKDGTLVDLQDNNVIPGEKGESNAGVPNKAYAFRLTALADKIKELFKEKSLDSLALQEIPYDTLTDSNKINLLGHLTEKLKPLVLIPPNRYPGKDSAPDVALVVKHDSPMKPQISSEFLRAQSYCDFETKACIVSTHLAGAKTHIDAKNLSHEEFDAKLAEKLIPVCEEIEIFAEDLKELQFTDIKYLGDFNVSAQNIKKACKWQQAPIIRSYEGPGSSCSDNAGKLSKENIDILIEFNYKN